jgi:3-vinyl bacteriochlorophyllide hydratase
MMNTTEQITNRNASPLARAMMIIGGAELVLLILNFYYVLHFLNTGEGWAGAQITFWTNFVLLWLNTIIGIIWEKQFCNEYFMCREFFWQDVGNLAALLSYAFFFVGLWQQWSLKGLAASMLVAGAVYGINFAQWIYKRMIARKGEG